MDIYFAFISGLPDGIFAYHKSQFGCILGGLGIVGIFNAHFV
jgi:hypothetical protein